MVKVVVNDSKGLVQYAGQGFISEGVGLDVSAGLSGSAAGSRTGEVQTRQIVGRFAGAGAAAADPYAESATKLFPLGTKLEVGGKTFRYARAAAATIAVGEIVQAAAPVANNNDIAVNQIGGIEPLATATELSVELGGAPTVNAFEDGYVVTVDGTGQGQMLAVASNTGGATTTVLQLMNPIRVALVAGVTKASVFVNQYADVIKSAAAPSSGILGVAPIGVTASYYFWLQVAGPAAVVQAAANEPAAGKLAVVSEGTAGAAEVFDGSSAAESGAIGMCLSSTVEAADHCVVMLNLE
jgi:hypothetical protein